MCTLFWDCKIWQERGAPICWAISGKLNRKSGTILVFVPGAGGGGSTIWACPILNRRSVQAVSVWVVLCFHVCYGQNTESVHHGPLSWAVLRCLAKSLTLCGLNGNPTTEPTKKLKSQGAGWRGAAKLGTVTMADVPSCSIGLFFSKLPSAWDVTVLVRQGLIVWSLSSCCVGLGSKTCSSIFLLHSQFWPHTQYKKLKVAFRLRQAFVLPSELMFPTLYASLKPRSCDSGKWQPLQRVC